MSALLRRSRPSPLCKGICTQCNCLCQCKKCDSSAESGSEDGDGKDTGHHAGLAEIRAILQQRYESSDKDGSQNRDKDTGDDGKAEDGGQAEIRAILQQRYESPDVDQGKDRDDDTGDDDGSTSSVDSFSSNDESESQSSADEDGEDTGHHPGLAALRAYLQHEYK